MKCTAYYGVVYRGNLYSAGETFEINPEDSAEMRKHGEVCCEEPMHDEQPVVIAKRPPGRPRKNTV